MARQSYFFCRKTIFLSRTMSANFNDFKSILWKRRKISTNAKPGSTEFKEIKKGIMQDNRMISEEFGGLKLSPVKVIFENEDIQDATSDALSTTFDKGPHLQMTTAEEFHSYRKHWTDHFDVPQILEAVAHCGQPPQIIIYGDVLESTQAILESKSLLPLIRHYRLLCLASMQTKAQGRGDNRWHSQIGGLTFSLGFSIPSKMASQLPLVQYVVALATLEAIEKLSSKKCTKSLDFRIKWPNDLYHSGKKVGGHIARAEVDMDSGDFSVVIGLGLNVSNKPDLWRGTSNLESVLERKVTREEVLKAFLRIFDRRLATFKQKGFAPMKEAYLSRWLHTGQTVKIASNGVHCTVRGLSDCGSLIAVNNLGQVFELSPDGNSFDFFHGLISRKVPRA